MFNILLIFAVELNVCLSFIMLIFGPRVSDRPYDLGLSVCGSVCDTRSQEPLIYKFWNFEGW